MTVGDRFVKGGGLAPPGALAQPGGTAQSGTLTQAGGAIQPGGYVRTDSALLRTADDLLARHTSDSSGMCTSCGQFSPCASARHAEEVRRAAGLAGPVPALGVNGAAPPVDHTARRFPGEHLVDEHVPADPRPAHEYPD
jgi:hypothetical protein